MEKIKFIIVEERFDDVAGFSAQRKIGAVGALVF